MRPAYTGITMTHTETSPKPSHRRYFFEKFGLTERLLERCLGEALSAGGDYADLYFESVTATALGVDEQIVKSASQGTSAGLRHPRAERRAHRLRLYRQPERGAAAARGADRGADCLRPGETAGAGVHRDARRGFVPGSAGRIRPGSGGAAGTDSSRRPRGASLRCARRAGAGELRRRAAADSDCRIRWRVCQRHAAALPAECVCDCQRRRGDDEGFGRRRRTRRPGAIHSVQKPGKPGARGGARRDFATGRGGCAGRRDGSGAGAGLAGNSAARSGGAWTGSRLQPQEDLGVYGIDRAAGGEPEGDGGRQRNHRRAARLAERGRRGLGDAGDGADRGRRAEGLFIRQAFGAADGHGEHRDRDGAKATSRFPCRA